MAELGRKDCSIQSSLLTLIFAESVKLRSSGDRICLYWKLL